MKKYQRIFTIVLDSLGVGAMPDAAEYGDAGCDTLGHIRSADREFQDSEPSEAGYGKSVISFKRCSASGSSPWPAMES